MASWELQLVSRILRTGELRKVQEYGITTDDFLTDTGREQFSRIVNYASSPNTHGSIFGIHAARQAFPNFEICDDETMSTEALCAEVRRSRITVDVKAHAQRLLDAADSDPLGAAAQASQGLKEALSLGFEVQHDTSFSDAFERSVDRYELMEQGVDFSVAKWPWHIMNNVTGGIQKDDYIVYYGRPKSMKSYVLSYQVAWTYNMGKRPLVYTKEMTADNIFDRIAASIAELPYQEYRMAKLNPEQKERMYELRSMLRDMRKYNEMYCLSGRDAPGRKDTVEWLQSKVEKYKPDIVFIDGMYLMSDGNGKLKDNIRVQNISRAIRQMILDTKIPVIATLQANRNAAKHANAELDEIAFSDAIGQDATTAIRVINEKGNPTIALVIGGSREWYLHGFRIHGIPCTNFGFYSEMTDKDISKAKEKDTDEPGNANASAHAKPTNGASTKAEAVKASNSAQRRHLSSLKPTS